MFAGAPQWSTEDDGGSAVVHTTRQCDEALSLNQWITSNRVGIESHQLETAEWRNYLERSVLVLRSLVEKMAGGGSGVDEILWMHPNYITAENITVRDQTSMGGEVAADFMERGDSVFFGVGEEDMREKRVAMDALGRVAYDMVMLLGGPSISELLRHYFNSQHGGDAVEAKTDEEEVIDILRKLPRMTTSEEKGDGRGVIATMLEANVPYPLCRFVSDLLGDGGDETIGRSEYSFTSFADVLSDLRQMVDNPDAFLHPSSTHQWKLAFGEKLYGREKETKVFFDAADRVATAHDDPVLAELSSLIGGSKEVIMVSGHSGAGKSRLVQLAGTALEKKGWRFLRCKFDRVAHSEPLSVLASAFDDYFASLFAGCPKHGIDGLFSLSSEAECCCTGLEEIRHRLKKICAEGLGKLAKHIPSLHELDLIDSTLPASTVEVTETEIRLQFGKLLQALSSRRSPILLFVDDLQWADPLSLAMLAALVKGSRPDLLHLVYTDDEDSSRAGPEDEADVNVLFVGSYRDKEIDDDHQLTKILANFQSDSSIKLTNISVSGFTHQTLNQMLSETLYMPVRRVGSLSTLVIQKTDGHPLHVIEFVRAMTADKLLTHSFSRGWEWDADSIDSFPITDSVAELFAFKLRRLPKDTLRGLQILSCFGSQIDQHVLKFVAGYDGNESVDLSAAIHVALREGLLDQAAQIVRFAHDTIQKATTDSIGKEEFVELLGKLSSALIVNATATGELDSVLFVVIDLIDVIGSSATLSPRCGTV